MTNYINDYSFSLNINIQAFCQYISSVVTNFYWPTIYNDINQLNRVQESKVMVPNQRRPPEYTMLLVRVSPESMLLPCGWGSACGKVKYP